MFSLNYRGVLFMIFTIPEPYFDDREAAAESANELRLAKAIREHDTHVTVKMMDNGSDLDEEGQLVLVRRLVREGFLVISEAARGNGADAEA